MTNKDKLLQMPVEELASRLLYYDYPSTTCVKKAWTGYGINYYFTFDEAKAAMIKYLESEAE